MGVMVRGELGEVEEKGGNHVCVLRAVKGSRGAVQLLPATYVADLV